MENSKIGGKKVSWKIMQGFISDINSEYLKGGISQGLIIQQGELWCHVVI